MRTESPAHPAFEIERKNPFFEATRQIVEREIRPGNTVSFVAEVDLDEVERVRGRNWEGRKPSYTSFVIKAVSLALKDYPYANRRVSRRLWFPWLTPRLQKFRRYDVAVAVERDFPGGESTAFIDIVRDADQRSLVEISEQLYDLSICDVVSNKQWQKFSGVITKSPTWLSTFLIRLPCFVPRLWIEWRGGSVLVSSPAKYGVDAVLGSWTHPLGVSFGLVKPRPVVRDGQIVVRPTFILTLNFDRRVMAGAQAARFFKRILDILERAGATMAPFLPPIAEPEVQGETQATTAPRSHDLLSVAPECVNEGTGSLEPLA